MQRLSTTPLAALAAGLLACAAAPPGPTVFVTDDGERVPRDAGPRPRAASPVWSPGQPVRLFGLPGEVLALQVGVSARATPLRGVTARLRGLPEGARVESLVVLDLPLRRRSGGRTPGESLGWSRGAMPRTYPPDPTVTSVPDPLIPSALAPPDADYPMTVAAHEHRLLWLDLTLPAAPGHHRATLELASTEGPLATLPVLLEIGGPPLPYAAAPALVFYDPDEIIGRIGDPAAVPRALQLLHAHHIQPVYRLNSAADVADQAAALRGDLYTAAAGYDGPGPGVGADVVFLGTYGSLGDPGPAALARVREVSAALAQAGLAQTPAPQRYLYAVDEDCESPRAAAWRALLRQDPALADILVAQTCSLPPAQQAAEQALISADAFPIVVSGAVAGTVAAPAPARRPWVYNGSLPHTGTFLLDGDPLSLRRNPWLQARHDIPRWFYWESTFWNDDNRGGRGPIDPLTQAETFHNRHGDHANGDGVLLYPGRQVALAPRRPLPPQTPETGAPLRSFGWPGVFPSLRLKQWRRGIQDVAYLHLARQRCHDDPAARADLAALVEAAPSTATPVAYQQLRRRLFDWIAACPPRATMKEGAHVVFSSSPLHVSRPRPLRLRRLRRRRQRRRGLPPAAQRHGDRPERRGPHARRPRLPGRQRPAAAARRRALRALRQR